MKPKLRVLEVGCAEGGVLRAFVDEGCLGTGVELDALRFEQASVYLRKEIADGRIELYNKNIFDPNFKEKFRGGEFDLIILKDVIEHVHEQEKLLSALKEYLKPNGHVFLGFPPWYMPFGGHQQICKSKVLSRLPWIHLLPKIAYKFLLNKSKEDVAYLMDIKETGIGINRFEKIYKGAGYSLVGKEHFLISPIYEYKFGLKPRRQFKFIKQIPYLRDFFTTGVYYIIKPVE
ncbi:MAG TPA: class I SAM-dependent methyltransferase [Dysgonamonadaceae bacterium]|nr:class I SAM-dependent methyltransferase [Dysgonamonadaceae bacterium]